MKAYFYNVGTCTRVKLYGLDVIELFKINDWVVVENQDDADYIFVNTCSFLESKSSYFLRFLEKLNKKKEKNKN